MVRIAVAHASEMSRWEVTGGTTTETPGGSSAFLSDRIMGRRIDRTRMSIGGPNLFFGVKCILEIEELQVMSVFQPDRHGHFL